MLDASKRILQFEQSISIQYLIPEFNAIFFANHPVCFHAPNSFNKEYMQECFQYAGRNNDYNPVLKKSIQWDFYAIRHITLHALEVCSLSFLQ